MGETELCPRRVAGARPSDDVIEVKVPVRVVSALRMIVFVQ